MKKTWFRFTLILFFVSLLTSSAITTVQAKMYEREFRTIKSNYPNTLVFNFEIETSTGYEFLSFDEFVLYEEIDNYIFTILSLPDQVTLSSVGITLTSPSGKEFQNTIERQKWFDEKNTPIRSLVYNLPSEFNESGIWYLELYFTTSEKVYPWEFIGHIRYFDEYSTIRTTYRYERYNYYKKGITIFSLNEFVQLRAAKAAEDSAKYSLYALIFLFSTAIATFVAAYISYRNSSIFARKGKETGILNLIVEAIKPAIKEFENLKKSVDRIKDGEIVTLPNNITDEVLSETQWSDFRKETPKYNGNFVSFKDIQKYLDKKNEYNKLREDCLNEIINKVKNLNITKIEKFLIKSMKKSKFKGTKEAFFKKIIAKDLSISILQNEKTKNEFSNELFEKYKKSLFKIREKSLVNEKINNIIKFSKKLKKFQGYSKNLRSYNRSSLLRKYNLTDYQWKTFKKSKN